MPQVNNLSYGKDGMELTERFEGLRLTAYQDQAGVWTIGYGHTGPDVYRGLCITQNEACVLLLRDIATAERCVNGLVEVALTQDEFDALVDFVFNIGPTKFAASTLLRKLNKGDFNGAVAEFGKWSHAGGKVAAGLLRRRTAEAEMFERGVESSEQHAEAAIAVG